MTDFKLRPLKWRFPEKYLLNQSFSLLVGDFWFPEAVGVVKRTIGSKPLGVARLEGGFSHNRTKNNNTSGPSRTDLNTVIGTVHTRTMRQSNGICA
jgi:hypothetical protein